MEDLEGSIQQYMLHAVPVVKDFLHLFSTRVKIFISAGYREALLAFYGITESGWMDSSMFLSWFMKLFCPAVAHLTSSGPVFLFFDGHYSHISLELIRKA